MFNFLKSFSKVLLLLLLLSSFFQLFFTSASAHAIDISYMYLYVGKETDGLEIASNKAVGYFYYNWYQAAALVQREKGFEPEDIYALLDYEDLYKEYLLTQMEFKNNGEPCEISFKDVSGTEAAVPLDVGLRLVIEFTCPNSLQSVTFKNVAFQDLFEFETNELTLIYGEKDIDKIELNKFYTTATMQIDNENSQLIKPADIISTNGQLSPSDPNYANQEFQPKTEQKTEVVSNSENIFSKYFHNILSNFGFLKNIDFREKPFLYVLGLTFILGFLHTVEAGHSKVILASAMVHKNMNVRRGIIYALIFTITHIGDIILIGVALLVLNNFVDVYSKFNLLEKYAAYALLTLAIYMLFKNTSDYIKQRNLKKKETEHDHSHGHHDHSPHDHQENPLGIHTHADGSTHSHLPDENQSVAHQFLMGFLSGLAPCVFGWSIFMLILSTKRIWLLVPSILSFAFGILVALIIVVFLSHSLRKPVYNRIGFFMDISPIISALILLLYAGLILI